MGSTFSVLELAATLTQLTPCIAAKAGTESGPSPCRQSRKRCTTNIPWCAVDGTKLAIAYSVAGGAVDSPDLPVTYSTAGSPDLSIAETVRRSPIDASYLAITDPQSGGSRAGELDGTGCA